MWDTRERRQMLKYLSGKILGNKILYFKVVLKAGRDILKYNLKK
jgi:hypothetical protein